jgi:protein-tyrosine kinase
LSRIEKALEKAAELKGQKNVEPAPGRLEKAMEKAAALGGSPNTPVAGRKADMYVLPDHDLSIDHPLVVTYMDPKSPISEEFRKLKSYLVNLERQGEVRRTLMVTSSIGGEGKSITAINLAITLAQEFDHTVLLVDADLRKQSINNFFHLENGKGLADCLQDGMDLGAGLVKTGIGKLSLLPAGREVENPAELLASDRMRQLLQEMRNRYPDRYIILDTPPVLPVSETRILSNLVDGVIFVVKEGAVSLPNIQDALNSVSKSKVIGIVYNHINPESLAGHYHPYYHGY